MMANEPMYLTGQCPNCGASLDYPVNEKMEPLGQIVICNCCDSRLSAQQIAARNGYSSRPEAQPLSTPAEGAASPLTSLIGAVDSPESGLAYLENFIEKSSLDEFARSPKLTIQELTEMVEKNKIRYSSSPLTWILEFRATVFLLETKLSGLTALENEICERYNERDFTDAYESFDAYASLSRNLVAKRAELLAQLSADLSSAEKQGAEQETLAPLTNVLDTLTDRLRAVREVAVMQDIPAYATMLEKKEKEKIAELAARGIDATTVYEEACNAFARGDTLAALNGFATLDGFRDSERYLKEINHFVLFDGKYLELGDKRFYIRAQKETYSLDVSELGKKGKKGKKKKKNAVEEETPYTGSTLALYAIGESGEPEAKPCLSGISYFLKFWGDQLYYIERGRKICRATVSALTNPVDEGNGKAKESDSITVLDTAHTGDYCTEDGAVLFNAASTKIFIKKKLPAAVTKSGCLKNLFHRHKVDLNSNNYSVLELDVSALTCRTVLPEIVDIMDFFGDCIFYTHIPHNAADDATMFYCYNTATGETEQILDSECVIHNVVNGKVIYSLWAPNEYNMDLWALDLASRQSILLENNIYDYFTTIDGKVYYTIGNEDFKPLYSIHTDGTCRTEIMTNAEKICLIRAGWMYIIKGQGSNALLVKISSDGKKYTALCPHFYRMVEMTNGYIYYINWHDQLCAVRCDGTGNRVIADNLDKDRVAVDRSFIYYLRRETVETVARRNALLEETYEDREAYSLYRMDLSGHEVKKLAFDIQTMEQNDAEDDLLYISRKETVTFRVSTPINKKEYSHTITTRTITRIMTYSKSKGTLSTVLTLGMPNHDSVELRSGCLHRKTNKETILTVIPNKPKFERKGKAKAGAVLQSSQSAAAPATTSSTAATAATATAAPAKVVTAAPSASTTAGGSKRVPPVAAFFILILSLIPILGLIFFLAFRKSSPGIARAAGVFSLLTTLAYAGFNIAQLVGRIVYGKTIYPNHIVPIAIALVLAILIIILIRSVRKK